MADTQSIAMSSVDEQKAWTKEIVKRMMQAWNVSDHNALAIKCDVHGRTPSNWIQNKSVPQPMVYHCHQQTGRSLDWLYNGKEPAVTISEKQRQTFAADAKSLLLNSELLGLITPTESGDYDLLIKGLTNCFVNVIAAKDNTGQE